MGLRDCVIERVYVKLRENLTKIKNILTHWSGAQAGSNEEKKLEVEYLVGLSL